MDSYEMPTATPYISQLASKRDSDSGKETQTALLRGSPDSSVNDGNSGNGGNGGYKSNGQNMYTL